MTETRSRRSTWGIATCLFLIVSLFYLRRLEPGFTFDHWSYYELSKTVFSDFYRINTFRHFQSDWPYSTAFPPLYPVLLACLREVRDVGIYAASLLNLLVGLATLPALIALSRTLGHSSRLACLLYVTLLSNWSYLHEATAGGTIPLSVLLLVWMLRGYVRPRPLTPGLGLLFGALAGACIMNRFDFLAAGVAFGIILNLESRGTWTYWLGLLLAVSPWVVYSQLRFGRFWASDNSLTALAVETSHAMALHPRLNEVETVFSAPAQWARAVLVERVPGLFLEGAKALVFNAPFLATFLGFGALLLVLAWPHGVRARLQTRQNRRLLAFSVVLLGQLLAVTLTGYTSEWRYYIPTFLYLSIVSLHLGLMAFEALPEPTRSRLGRALLASGHAVFLIASLWSLKRVFEPGLLPPRPLWASKHLEVQEFEPVLSELRKYPGRPRLLVLGPRNEALAYVKFGAMTGIETVLQPVNITADSVGELTSRFRPTHILDIGHEYVPVLERDYRLAPLAVEDLFRVESVRGGGSG